MDSIARILFMPNNKRAEIRHQRTWGTIAGMALLIVLLPLVLILLLLWFAAAVGLHVITLVMWSPRGRNVLFVYSDSPVWKGYVEDTSCRACQRAP